MAKKSQIRARRNNTQVGQGIVNNYKFGTVNIDGRQNNSVTYKHDNRGSNIYYPNRPCRHRLGDYMAGVLESDKCHESTQTVANKTEMPKTSNTIHRKKSTFTKFLIGSSIAVVATLIGIKINHKIQKK